MTPSRETRPTVRRRQVLALLSAGVPTMVAGCGSRSGTIGYGDRSTVDVSNVSATNASNTTANASNASAANAAAARAEQNGDRYAVELDALALRDHELVVREDYRGAVIQGAVENTGRQRVKRVEVRTRVYDADGEQLGRYLDSTHDLAAGATWKFGVIVLEDPSDIASYDIAVLGSLG